MQKPIWTALQTEDTRVGVVGVGYVGLPLACALADARYRVIAYDTPERTAALQSGEPRVITTAAETLKRALAQGRLHPTADPQLLGDCRAITICVPTPLGSGGQPDLRALRAATEVVAQHARQATLIILESTSYPGTTREILLPALSRRLGEVGRDFFCAFAPERIDPGNPRFGLRQTPHLIGGVTQACTDLACMYYRRGVSPCHPVASPEIAEMAKLLENAYRNVNIALINELMQLCDHLQLNVDAVISAAATKPFGFAAFHPGPGVGGECLPIDPRYLTWAARRAQRPLRMLEQAMDVNEAMPLYAAGKVVGALNAVGLPVRRSRVLLLGVTYKPNVPDTRQSPAEGIGANLVEQGAELLYHDPLVPQWRLGERTLQSQPLTDALLLQADLTVLVVAHQGFDAQNLPARARRFLDLTHPGIVAAPAHETGSTPEGGLACASS